VWGPIFYLGQTGKINHDSQKLAKKTRKKKEVGDIGEREWGQKAKWGNQQRLQNRNGSRGTKSKWR